MNASHQYKYTSSIQEIPRRKVFDRHDFYHRFYKKNLPVIFENLASNWAVVNENSIDRFVSEHGAESFYFITGCENNPLEKTTVSDLIQRFRDGGPEHVSFYPYSERQQNFSQMVNLDFLNRYTHSLCLRLPTTAFLSGKTAWTRLHQENQSNFCIGIEGKKLWRLYPPTITKELNPPEPSFLYRDGSSFNPFEDSESDLYSASGLTGILNRGDVLYNPPFYWHAVKNLTESFMISHRWIDPLKMLHQHPIEFLKTLRPQKPSVLESIRLCKLDFNLLLVEFHGLSNLIH